jgi:hypothetical protein
VAEGVWLASCGGQSASMLGLVSDGALTSVSSITAAAKLGGLPPVLGSVQQLWEWWGIGMSGPLVFFMTWMNPRVSGQNLI